jgi:hypothetical protein
MLAALLALTLIAAASPRTVYGQLYSDVPVDFWAASYIYDLTEAGITSGCGGGNYCPSDPVTRAQMSVFLERGMRGAGYAPPAASGSMFADVGASDFAAAFIEQLANDGITSGCSDGAFCPNDPVTRAQMAVFLLRAIHGSGFSPPPASGLFLDVDVTYWAAPWIEQLAALGITAGCGGGNYCPEAPVQRDQMAVFLVRAFDLLTGPLPLQLTLDGMTSDARLANANITATVFRSGSASAESSDFVGVADASGSFSVDIQGQPGDFVIVRASGVDMQAGIVLTSHLGTIQALKDRSFNDRVGIDDYGALDITHVSTALAVLGERALGSSTYSDEDLDAAQRKVPGPDLLNMAAAIKAYSDYGVIELPVGSDNTLELVTDPVAYAGFLAELEANYPQQLAAATGQIAESLQQRFGLSSLPGTTYLISHYPRTSPFSTYVLNRNPDGTGTVVMNEGAADATWSIGFNGDIIIDLVNSPVVERFPPNPDPNSPIPQVRALTYADRLTLKPFGRGLFTDQIIVIRRNVTEYPDNPELPSEVVAESIDEFKVFLAVADTETRPFSAGELANRQIAAGYFHQANDSRTWVDPDFGADILTFNSNGTGITSRRLLSFVWSIDASGAALIRFTNGDESRIVRFDKETIVDRTVVTGEMTSGVSKSFGSRAIVHDTAESFTDVMLANRRYRQLASVADPEFIIDQLFFPGGVGCRETSADESVFHHALDWSSTPEGFMDYRRYLSSLPGIPWTRRSWELVAIETGIFGDRYWVIETVESNDTQEADYPFAVPGITPGRINAYEFIQDLTGLPNPCSP